jgi:protein TonB
MPRSLHFLRYILFSFGLHGLLLAALFYFMGPTGGAPQETTPVKIVDLPPQVAKRLPPVEQPLPRPLPPDETSRPRGSVPAPKRFGQGDEVRLPGTTPPGVEKGSETGKGDTALKPGPGPGKSPLPFLSQADIDELARKGMPPKKPGDDSVTLDTDELKLISYNRWLKIKVESNLRYPELAAISGYQGVLYIKFDIMKDGSLANLELLKSSGYKILDDEALRGIRASAPFQPLPDDWDMPRYSIRAAVIFYLSSTYIR